MFCGHCGKETQATAKFCGSCGRATIKAHPHPFTNANSTPPEPKPVVDPSNTISPPKAGVQATAILPIEQTTAMSKSSNSSAPLTGLRAQPTKQPQGKRSFPFLVATVVVVISLAGLVIFLVNRNRTVQPTAAVATLPSVTKPSLGDSGKTALAAETTHAVVDKAPPPIIASIDAHSCFNLSNHEPHALDGRLVAAIFPGSPDFTDVRKGDDPEAGYVLQLKDSICIRDDGEDGAADPSVRISEVQLAAQDDLRTIADMRSLVGMVVHAELSAAQAETTGHHHRPLVGWVSNIVSLDNGTSIAIPRTVFPAVYSANQSSEIGTAATTVRGFYYALGQGNGEGASQFIIPEKRQTGAYAPENVDRFFGPLPEPVRLLRLEPQSPHKTNEYLVTYAFGTGTRRCQNRAVVTTTLRDGLNLIEKIRQLDECGAPASTDNSSAIAATPRPSNRPNDEIRSSRDLRPTNIAVTQTPVRMDPRHPLKIGEAYYPDDSKRAKEEGRCVVEVTVASDGRVTAEAVQDSSGFPRLDEACLKGVHGEHMLPATENGKPIQVTVLLPIVWKLTGQ